MAETSAATVSKEKYDTLKTKYQQEAATNRRLNEELASANRQLNKLKAENESYTSQHLSIESKRLALADLCRKLQETNTALVAENRTIREAEETKRTEHFAKVTQTIENVQEKMTSLTDQTKATETLNSSLRLENDALRSKALAVADALDKVEAKYRAELELRVLEVKMAAAHQAKAEAIAKESEARVEEMKQAVEAATKRDADIRKRLDEIAKAQEKHNEIEKLQDARLKEAAKKCEFLEKGKLSSDKALLESLNGQLAAEKAKKKIEAEMASAATQMQKVLALCKTLQAERKTLMERLQVASGVGSSGNGGVSSESVGEGVGDGNSIIINGSEETITTTDSSGSEISSSSGTDVLVETVAALTSTTTAE